MRNKIFFLKDFIVDCNIDVFFVIEIWFVKEIDELIICDLCLIGYEFYNVLRVFCVGGGIGVMYKIVVCFEKYFGIVINFKFFEFMDVLLKYFLLCLCFIIVYRL